MDKWKVLGYVASLCNPLPTGLIAGYCLWSERKYKRTGRNVIIISIVWTAILMVWVWLRM